MSAALELGLVVFLALSVPHLLPLQRVPPRTAAVLWLLALSLRALVSVAAAIFLLVYLPQTELFGALADWCVHAVLPILATHFGLSGHQLGHIAVILPALALAASLSWAVLGFLHALLAVRRRLRRRERRDGPFGSVVVADPELLVAVPVIGSANPLISEVALKSFDEEEVRASLAHELGHVRRWHRPLLVAGVVAAALSRALPGTGRAERAFRFHLERDADAYAVGLTRDPLALGSAICKTVEAHAGKALAALGGGGQVEVRLRELVDAQGLPYQRRAVWLARLAVVLLGALVLSLLATLPAWALAGPADVGLGPREMAEVLCR